jgi:hypothetical protein
VSVGCIFGFVLMLPDAHAVCARPAVLPGRLLLMRLRIAAHLCSRSAIWALRKATPTLEAVKFGNKPTSDVLQARFFVGIKSDINISLAPWSMQSGRDRPRGRFDAAHSLYPQAPFRRDQHNKTLVLYTFPAVSLAAMARSEVEICLRSLWRNRTVFGTL